MEIVEKLAEKLKRAKIVVLSSFSKRNKKGLDFNTMKRLKKNLKEANSDYVVSKKTLLDLAFKKVSLSSIKVKELEGSIGVLIGYGDIIEPTKILYKLLKENESLSLYLGVTPEDKKIISKDNLVELANLPSREILLGQMTWVIRYPLWGLVNVLQGNIRGLAVALSQIKK